MIQKLGPAMPFYFFFKTDHVTNNITESWNAVLFEYKRKPIIELIEFI